MNCIVFDLEWNQPVSAKQRQCTPLLLNGEIIQIGAVKTDEDFNVADTFKITVSPKYYRKMHKHVSKLTGITTDDLQYGFPFPTAFKHFIKWCGTDFTFFTWGPDDIKMLRDNMVLHKLNTDLLPDTYNVQMIFDNQITRENRQISLEYAMEKIGKQPLESHDALNDAKNTVSICRHLDMVKGMAEYGKLQKCFFGNKETSKKTYLSQASALKEPDTVNFLCPTCGSAIKCTGIIRQNAVKHICIAKCENGDEFFVRFKFHKEQNGKVGISRIIYELTEDNRMYYLLQKQNSNKTDVAHLSKAN